MSQSEKMVLIPLRLLEFMGGKNKGGHIHDAAAEIQYLLEHADQQSSEASKVADALAACNWANAPIGNKAILAQAIALLRADQHQGALLGYIWPEEIDGPNRCRVMTVSRPGDFMPNMIPVYQVPQLIQGEPVAWLKNGEPKPYFTVDSKHAELWPEQWRPIYTHADPGEVERKAVKRYDRDEVGGHSDVEITVPGLLHHDHGPNLAEALARLAYRVAKFHKLDAPSLADPCEVERLRTELTRMHESNWKSSQFGIKLQAKLAERDALLEEAYRDGWNDGQEAIEQRYQNTPRTSTAGWERFKADNALSASAEPSATKCKTCNGTGMVDDGEITSSDGVPFDNGPVKCVKDCPTCKSVSPVEDDGKEAFEKRFGPGTWGHPDYTDELIGWRMRAALERNNRPGHERNRKNAERYVWLRDNADASWEHWFVKERSDGTGAAEADKDVDHWMSKLATEAKP